jgi:hypothetical protein
VSSDASPSSDPQDDLDPASEREPKLEPAVDPSEAGDHEPDEAGEPRDTNGLAIAATVALVLFSVFIGVFGPRIGNRQQLPAGVTLVELAEAITSRSRTYADRDASGRGAVLNEAEFGERLDVLTGRSVPLPSFDDLKMRPSSLNRVKLPGASGGFAVFHTDTGTKDFVASIAVLTDEDRFTVFDRFGRPIALPEGEVFAVDDPHGVPPGTVDVFRRGDLVFAVHARTADQANALASLLQYAAARRPAGEHPAVE